MGTAELAEALHAGAYVLAGVTRRRYEPRPGVVQFCRQAADVRMRRNGKYGGVNGGTLTRRGCQRIRTTRTHTPTSSNIQRQAQTHVHEKVVRRSPLLPSPPSFLIEEPPASFTPARVQVGNAVFWRNVQTPGEPYVRAKRRPRGKPTGCRRHNPDRVVERVHRQAYVVNLAAAEYR